MPVVNIQMFDGRDDAKPAIAKAVTEAYRNTCQS